MLQKSGASPRNTVGFLRWARFPEWAFCLGLGSLVFGSEA